MCAAWTPEKVQALAPDSRSAQAGLALAGTAKWSELGAGEPGHLAWGDFQGSARKPYRVAVDLDKPTFKCSCPSRKSPCKHCLGLLFLYADRPERFPAASVPEFVRQWQAKQAQRPTQSPPPVNEAARRRRLAQRLERVQAGLMALDLRLQDLVQQGLATAPSLPPSFWEDAAAQLVDAQAGGLAPTVRGLGAMTRRGADWPSLLVRALGRLHLLCHAFQIYDQLGPAQQADLRAAVGWASQHDAIRAEPGVADEWVVLGRRVEPVDRLYEQRTWLWGMRGNRPALIQAFAHGRDPLDSSLLPGTVVTAELSFFPGAAPLRALTRQRRGRPAPLSHFPGHHSLVTALIHAGRALAANPWQEVYPMPLRDVTPLRARSGWRLRDTKGQELPLRPTFGDGWSLLALSGGRPLSLLAEWDGATLLPLAVWSDRHFSPLRSQYS